MSNEEIKAANKRLINDLRYTTNYNAMQFNQITPNWSIKIVLRYLVLRTLDRFAPSLPLRSTPSADDWLCLKNVEFAEPKYTACDVMRTVIDRCYPIAQDTSASVFALVTMYRLAKPVKLLNVGDLRDIEILQNLPYRDVKLNLRVFTYKDLVVYFVDTTHVVFINRSKNKTTDEDDNWLVSAWYLGGVMKYIIESCTGMPLDDEPTKHLTMEKEFITKPTPQQKRQLLIYKTHNDPCSYDTLIANDAVIRNPNYYITYRANIANGGAMLSGIAFSHWEELRRVFGIPSPNQLTRIRRSNREHSKSKTWG